jgi:ABC-2 type transport system permease protein
MFALARTIPAYLREALGTMLQYRGEIVLWAIWGVVYPAVSMAMWSAAVKGSSSGAEIRGFTPSDFAAYFWLTMVIGHITTAWDVYELSYEVQSGKLSPRLLRPVLPVWHSLANNIAYKVVSLAVLVPIWLLIVVITRPTFGGDRHDLLVSIPIVCMATIINFIWCNNFAMLAFWLTRMDAVGQAWFGAGLFLGGRLAPLTIMPKPLRNLASALPFKWVIWFPCETLMGHLKDKHVYGGMIIQLFWIGLGLVVFKVMWHFGVRRYSAVGA